MSDVAKTERNDIQAELADLYQEADQQKKVMRAIYKKINDLELRLVHAKGD